MKAITKVMTTLSNKSHGNYFYECLWRPKEATPPVGLEELIEVDLVGAQQHTNVLLLRFGLAFPPLPPTMSIFRVVLGLLIRSLRFLALV